MENLRVLCVEPDADIRVVIDLSLGLDPSIDARIVGHISEARKALDDGDWVPDCLVLETIKPGAIGAGAYHAIRSHPRYSAVKVVVLTGAVDQNSMASYATLGAWGVISKPFDPLMLAEQIRSSIRDDKQLAT